MQRYICQVPEPSQATTTRAVDALNGRGRSAVADAGRTARPAWFAVVMATGIVSIALLRVHSGLLSTALLFVALGCFCVIALANLTSAIASPGGPAGELRDASRAFTSFAVVAALDVVGARLADSGLTAAAAAFAAAAFAVWLLLASILPFRLAAGGPVRVKDVSGTWYLCVVGTQSLAIAAAFLRSGGMLPAALASWAGTTALLLGAFGYVAVSTTVALRLRAIGLPACEPTASYWVAMGAASITALAAAQLRLAAAGPATIGTFALTVIATASWAIASSLLPLLAVRSCRRHLSGTAPLRYRADLWMVVFPAGMYSVASIEVGTVTGWPVLRGIGVAAAWVAAAAWALTFAAMAVSGLRRARPDGSG